MKSMRIRPSRSLPLVVLLILCALAAELAGLNPISYYYRQTGETSFGRVLTSYATWVYGENTRPRIQAAIYIPQLTPQSGAAANVSVQFGYGITRSNPTQFPIWMNASYLWDEAGADMYFTLGPDLMPGRYYYLIRYRYNSGNWIYADLDGSANGIAVDQLGVLDVLPSEATPTPSPSSTPEVVNSPTPEVTPVDTSAPTPTAAPTEAPTATPTSPPSPTPSPTLIQFTFSGGSEGWTYHRTGVFDSPSSDVLPGTPGVLTLRSVNNTNTFGYWESPPLEISPLTSGENATQGLFDSSDSNNPAIIRLNGNTGVNTVYSARYYLRSNVSEVRRVPQLRLRTNAMNLQQSYVLVADSREDGAYSPDSNGRSYTLLFSPAEGATSFTLSYDLLNFNPADAENGDLQLDSVELAARTDIATLEKTTVHTYDFIEDNEGWKQHSTSTFQSPVFSWSPGALSITGVAKNANVFGYWNSPENEITIEPGRLYIATFTIASSLSEENRSKVPQFRCRLNEDGYHASSYLAVESRKDGARSPVAGQPQTYTVYFLPPIAAYGHYLMECFDFLNFDPNDQSDATLSLQKVQIETAPMAAPDNSIYGKVLDSYGNPFEGVTVGLFSIDAASDTVDPLFSTGQTVTDQRGYYFISNVPTQSTYFRVGVYRSGYVPTFGPVLQLPEALSYELPAITLGTGVTIQGKVVNSKGEALGGVSVTIPSWTQFTATGDIPKRFNASPPQTVASITGTFSLPGIEAGSKNMGIYCSGYITKTMTVDAQPPFIDLGNITLLMLSEAGSGTIVGSLTDELGKTYPNANCTLRCTNCASSVSDFQTTDQSGSFYFKNLPDGLYNLNIAASTLRDNGLWIVLSEQLGGLKPGQGTIRSVFDLGGKVPISVMDAMGEPITKFTATVFSKVEWPSDDPEADNYISASYSTIIESSTGKTVISNLVKGKMNLAIVADQDGVAEVRDINVPSEATSSSLMIMIGDGACLEGRVVTEEGRQPIAGATVETQRAPGSVSGYPYDRYHWKETTDADGKFRMTHLYPTSGFVLYVQAPYRVAVTTPVISAISKKTIQIEDIVMSLDGNVE